MTPPTPTPFEVAETARGRIYRLPPRQIGLYRLLALLPLGFVVMISVLLAKYYISRAAMGLPNDWFWAILVVLVPTWAWLVYTGLDITASLWCGHSEIEIAPDGMVSAYDRAGWFGICLSWFKRGIGLRLILEEFNPPPARSRQVLLPEPLWQLSAQDPNGKKGWLAVGYPREILIALAERLAVELGVTPDDAVDPAQTESAPAVPTPVTVAADPVFPNRDTPQPPLNTRVTLERHPDGLTFTVPRLGLAGKNVEPFCLGAFIAVIGVFLTVITLLPLFQGGNLIFPPGLVIGSALVAAGSGLMAYCVNAGRKMVVFVVVGDRLLTFESGPLGSKRREFARADILDIACHPNSNVPDLQIVANDRTSVGLLAGRDPAELKWIATVLRQALGIPSEAPEHRPPVRSWLNRAAK